MMDLWNIINDMILAGDGGGRQAASKIELALPDSLSSNLLVHLPCLSTGLV
jgi:hypothetical protein